ncbi:hypothetical protein Tco_1124457, partial [Tanacetum coccineum]
MRYKAQICCGKRSRDNYFQDVWPPKPLKVEDCYKKPKSSPICNNTQSEESEDDNITVDPGWDDFCLTSAKLPRMEAHRLGKKTRTLPLSPIIGV